MTDLWRQCFLAALTGYVANPYTSEENGIPCDDIATYAANQADEAVKLIERRWPVKRVLPKLRLAGERRTGRNRKSAMRSRAK